MLTRVSAQELWQDGISVNELIPGPVRTAATRHRATASCDGTPEARLLLRQPGETPGSRGPLESLLA